MEIMTQAQYIEYRKQLKEQGFNHIDTTITMSDEWAFTELEKRLGLMPWNLLKIDRSTDK